VVLYTAVRSFKADAKDNADDSKVDGEVWNKREAWGQEVVYPLRRKFAIAMRKSGKCRRSVEQLENYIAKTARGATPLCCDHALNDLGDGLVEQANAARNLLRFLQMAEGERAAHWEAQVHKDRCS